MTGSTTASTHEPHPSSTEYIPLPATVAHRMLAGGQPFLVCKSCSNNCKTSNCCYGINCNLPGKPFGTCAFQPKTCGCSQCPS